MNVFRLQRDIFGKRRYVPVVAIMAAVATLILLLVIYTSRDLALARQRLEDSVLQGGLTLIRAIEAGSRTGMQMHWRVNQLQLLVEEIGVSPKIAYIRIFDKSGHVLVQTQKSYVTDISPINLERFSENPSTLLTSTLNFGQEHDVFEIVSGLVTRNAGGTGHHQMGHGRMSGQSEMPQMFEAPVAIQLGMSMTELHSLHHKDLRNALLMFLILSVAGSAALYFIVVLQNYHAINYAFHTMQSYAQHVVDSMANGLISLDTQGKIVTMNRQAHHILRLPQHNSVEGRTLEEVLHVENNDLFNVVEHGRPVIEQEINVTTASQHTLPLNLSASVLTDEHGVQLGTVLLFRDLSDVKALEEQISRSERLASVGKLAAGIAHEIRNPLGALKGFLQYFQRKLTFEKQDKRYLSVMVQEIDRLNTVISNLLDFARPKAPVREESDLRALIQHVLTLLESDFQTKTIQSVLALPEALPRIFLDQDQMTQVLLNILLNAIHATAPGGQIGVRVEPADDGGLVITISDSGQGIAPDDIAQIFDPFFSTKKQGTGLGLAIAHTIIEQHGGNIHVDSTPGHGTTFRIYLPHQPAEGQQGVLS